MYTTKLPYPVFKIEDTANARMHILPQAVSEITPEYFKTHPRFKRLGRVESSSLVDFMSVYEEGDSWNLTIIRVQEKNNQPRYIFLPLVADIESKMATKISEFVPIDLGDIAFGLETYSDFSGTRNWKVVDAFSDSRFMIKLIDLFLYVGANQANPYTYIAESGLGKFVFNLSPNFAEKWRDSDSILPALMESGDLLLRYSWGFQMEINSILPTMIDTAPFLSAPSTLGWITYSGSQAPELLIGVLEEKIEC